jgi:Tfp pilus assembly protein PilV
MSRSRAVGKSGTSLVEVLVSLVLLGLAWTASVRVLSGAARSLDEAELGFRALVLLAESGDDAVPPAQP